MLCSMVFLLPFLTLWLLAGVTSDVAASPSDCPAVDYCKGRNVDVTVVQIRQGPVQIRCHHSLRNYTCYLPARPFCKLGNISSLGLTKCDIWCRDVYRCARGGRCVSRSTVCDGNSCNGCSEEDDDWTSGIGFRCFRNGRYCRLPQQLLWDGIRDCDDGADICYRVNGSANNPRDLRNLSGVKFDTKKCFQCLDGATIIARRKVCDGKFDCSDLSDECLCERRRPGVCQNVQLKTERPGLCEVGELRCGPSKLCINRSAVCDGVVDCPERSDEAYASCGGTMPCKAGRPNDTGDRCRCNSGCDPRMGKICDGTDDCGFPGSVSKYAKWAVEPGFPEDECHAQCRRGTFNCTVDIRSAVSKGVSIYACETYIDPKRPNTGTTTRYYASDEGNQWCNGRLDCPANRGDERGCRDRYPCRSNGLVSIENSRLCDGAIDCDDGSDEDEMKCKNRFFCSSRRGTRVSVPKSVVCDFNINCDDAEDELNCTHLDGRFYCEGQRPLFVRANKKFDGVQDCADWSDECPSTGMAGQQNILSSRYELIGSPILRAAVWIMAVLAVIGNSLVIFDECKRLKKLSVSKSKASQRANHMLVLNLAFSDLLMGVYLTMLGIAGAAYSGTYCSKSLEWLTSKSCVAMGVLVVLSSETSVMTMVMLTACRLFTVVKPFSASRKPKGRTIAFFILLSWLVSFLLAFLPLSKSLESSFVETVLLERNPFFGNVVVGFPAGKKLVRLMATYSPHFGNLTARDIDDLSRVASWSGLEDFLASRVPVEVFKVRHYFGYYSSNSACIPNLFVTPNDRSWRFSLAVTVFNFAAFVFVAFTYAYIAYQVVKKSSRAGLGADRAAGRNTKTQKKVIRLIFTDFCCWIPLTVMVFVNFGGARIDDIAYAITAIILLPINSAFNPILYSTFVDSKLTSLCARGKQWSTQHFHLPSTQATHATAESRESAAQPDSTRQTTSNQTDSRGDQESRL